MYSRDQKYIYILIIVGISNFFCAPLYAPYASLSKVDPFPTYSTLDPYYFLQFGERLSYRHEPWADEKYERVSITFSGYLQNADRGKSVRGEQTFDPLTDTNTITELGDLTGRTSMIALLYGPLPAGATWTPTLTEARRELFGVTDPNFVINRGNDIDPKQLFGYFSFPLKYRKRGFAFDFQAGWADVGIALKGRFSNIQQTPRDFVDLTTEENINNIPQHDENVTFATVEKFLMDQFPLIMQQLPRDVGEFIKSSFEDLEVSVFWRHAFNCNPKESSEWPNLYIIPFIEAFGVFSPSHERDYRKQFGIGFGNNRHNAFGVHAGINLDFVETISVGFDGGVTHFTERDFENVPVPTSKFQTTIFPFTTDVSIKPGLSTYLSAQMSAIHFIDKLSCYLQYVILEHKEDKITLKNEDPAFLPKFLEKVTSFKVKLMNVGFNYDLAPWLCVGLAVQLPFSQRNAYRSQTTVFSINMTF